MSRLTSFCQEVYYGLSTEALRARYALVVFDLLIIAYFIVTTFTPDYAWIAAADAAIGTLLVIDYLARMIAHSDRGEFLVRPMSLLDLVVIGSLFVPAAFGNVAFLRIIRAMRLMRSYAVI